MQRYSFSVFVVDYMEFFVVVSVAGILRRNILGVGVFAMSSPFFGDYRCIFHRSGAAVVRLRPGVIF